MIVSIIFVNSKLQQNFLTVWIKVQSTDWKIHRHKGWKLTHKCRASNEFDFTFRLALVTWLGELFVVALVSIEVDTARHARLEQDHDGKEHFRADFLDDFCELFKTYFFVCSENNFNEFENFLLSLDSIEEHLAASTLLRKRAFTWNNTLYTVSDWDVTKDKSDIVLDDEAIFVEVVSKWLDNKTYISNTSLSLVSSVL